MSSGSRYGRVRALLAMVVAACSVAAMSACSGASDATQGSFTVAVPTGYYTHFTPGQSGSSYLDYALWTPLTTIDPKTREPVNAVARSVESDDQRVWNITLEDGWTFHDGTPVTAQSFADAWNATAYGPNAWIGNAEFSIVEGYDALNPVDGKPQTKKLSGVQVIDQHRLEVTLTEPFALFPEVIAATTWAPMPEVAFDDLDAFDSRPVGNGPFRLAGDEGLDEGTQQLSFERYDEYAGEKAKSRAFDAVFYQDNRTAYTSFKAGEVDITLVESGDVTEAESQFPDQFVRATPPAVVFLGFPLWDERFEDPQVRRAFSLAIDRDTIVDALLQGAATPADSLAPEYAIGSTEGMCDSCTYDPDRAADLLADAGGWSGPLTLWTKTDPVTPKVTEAIANMLRDNLGIEDVKVRSQPAAQLYPNMAEHATDGPFLLYTGATYPHLYKLAEALFLPGTSLNVTGYDDDAVTKALADAAAASNADETIERSQDAVRTALADLPLAPIYYPESGLVYSTRMGGVHADVLGDVRLADVTTD